jgi:predicted AlkP superfamily pyrophosphatase or phosphodiesterase
MSIRLSMMVVLLFAIAVLRPADVASAGRSQRDESTARPRLIVMLVVDQMRADYIETFERRWKHGIATLRSEGAIFDRAEYPYMNTVTCAGHATIGTGTFPHTHGMVLNAWWDRNRRTLISCTDDASSPAISYGERTRATFSGRLLRAQTFADELRAERPDSRVVSLSLKPRSAIGLAGHGGTVVTWTDDLSASFVTSRAFTASPIESARDFLRQTPYVADTRKTWLLAGPGDSYRYPDANAFARPPATQTGLFPHRFPAAAKSASTFFSLWQASPFSDAYLARMAARMIDTYELGQRQGTDVLAVSFSALDLIGHAYGPESREIEDALIRLDETIGALIDKLDADVGREHYLLALTSDHGVAAIPQTVGAARIATEDIRERIEETLVTHFGPNGQPGNAYVANVTFTNVYFADGVWNRLSTDDEAWRSTEAAVVAIPGVARLLRSDRLDPRSPDGDIRAAALSAVPDRSGDLIVVPKANWTLGPRAEQSATTHGTGHPYDRRIPLVLLGVGVKPGRWSGTASPADIAPTFAHVAGVTMSHVEGRVLREAFSETSAPASVLSERRSEAH